MARSPDGAPTASPRVCIITESQPFIWVPHYVNAFRKRCDVITVGPALDDEKLDLIGRTHLKHLVTRNDIDTELHTVDQLIAVLPSGWVPDLVVTIQSGIPKINGIERIGCPTAYISVDTWHDVNEFLRAQPYDFVFVAQREFVEPMRAFGARNVHWLPLACSPEEHGPAQVEQSWDIVFVGSYKRRSHATRIQRLERLSERFRVAIDDALSNADMCRAYSSAKLAFNSSIAQDVNMRVFEVMATGTALLTNRDAESNGLLDLFTDGVHLITYDDADLLDVAARYLADDHARRRVAESAYREVIARHTYLHRIDRLLQLVFEHAPMSVKTRRGLLPPLRGAKDGLPTAPGIVVDVGLGLNVSRYALRELGVTQFVGLTASGEEAARRRGSYDAIQLLPDDSLPTGVDTVVLHDFDTVLGDAAKTIAEAARMVRDGGVIVLSTDEQSLEALAVNFGAVDLHVWFANMGLVLLSVDTTLPESSDPGRMVLNLRKRSQSLREIARGIYTRYPMSDAQLDALIDGIPEHF